MTGETVECIITALSLINSGYVQEYSKPAPYTSLKKSYRTPLRKTHQSIWISKTAISESSRNRFRLLLDIPPATPYSDESHGKTAYLGSKLSQQILLQLEKSFDYTNYGHDKELLEKTITWKITFKKTYSRARTLATNSPTTRKVL
ncbi:hypothetical protein ACOME3_007606 [Neoechinorhynchus agilis]